MLLLSAVLGSSVYFTGTWRRRRICSSLPLWVFAASIAQAVPVSWTYDSRIEVVKTEIDNSDGSWDYIFNITNTDTQNILLSNIHTEAFEAYNLFSSTTS